MAPAVAAAPARGPCCGPCPWLWPLPVAVAGHLVMGMSDGLLISKIRICPPSTGLVSYNLDTILLMTHILFLIIPTVHSPMTLCSSSGPQNRALEGAKVPSSPAAT